MNYWIIPYNEEVFMLSKLLEFSNLVDWKQHNNFEEGDVVFIYNSKPLHRIKYKMLVDRVNVSSSEYINDRFFWKNNNDYVAALNENQFVRLRLLAEAPLDSKLNLDYLRKKGLKGNLQSVMKLSDHQLIYHIKKEIQPDTKEKIARLCWNTLGWERPSGAEGKSSSQNFESKNGFGHEEWLLDRSKICSDGYHYAFIEPLRKFSYSGRKDIHLYTYSPNGKLYVGCLRDAEYVSPESAKKIWDEYVCRGWDKDMLEDLHRCGICLNKPFLEVFNVRFKFENYTDCLGRSLYIKKNDPNTTNSHYVLLNKRDPFLFETINSQVQDSEYDSICDPDDRIPEGAKQRVSVNRYERSLEARRICLNKHGYACVVCGMDFESVYGELGKDFIHVHHVVPISEIGQSYKVNPETDLVPVCPNCHAMLHRGVEGRVLSIEELKEVIEKSKVFNK